MEAPAINSEGGSNAPSREEFSTAIGDLSAKLESLMMTMSQLVHGTAPTATGDGGESRGGRHTAPGAEQERLDQAPNTGGASDLQRHRSSSSVGDVSRTSWDMVIIRDSSFALRSPIAVLNSSREGAFDPPLLLPARATSSNNAQSRSARDVGGRNKTLARHC